MKKNIWILLDNRVGSRHQAEGIANYLDKSIFEISFKEIKYTKWSALPNFIRGKSLLGVDTTSKKDLFSPFPDMVLSASRRTAPIARWIKKQHPTTKLIQLLHIGRCGIKDFTAIFVPEHDKNKLCAPNIYYTVGSPHFITPEKLSNAHIQWNKKFSKLPHPITALIIGGAIKKKPFSLENAENLAKIVKNIKEKDHGSLLITTSRRTGLAAEQLIMSHLKNIPQFSYLWGNKDENPYLGFLACADNLIVTGDSVSMCCEATGAQKPLFIYTGKNWLTSKHLRFVQSLYDAGYASKLSCEENTPKAKTASPLPLNTAKDIAKILATL